MIFWHIFVSEPVRTAHVAEGFVFMPMSFKQELDRKVKSCLKRQFNFDVCAFITKLSMLLTWFVLKGMLIDR